MPYAGAWPSLFVGAPGTRSTCHVDSGSLHFAMALVHGGAKKWRVWRREDAAFLFPVRRLGGRRPLRPPRGGAAQPRWVVCQKPGDMIVRAVRLPARRRQRRRDGRHRDGPVDRLERRRGGGALADAGDAASLRCAAALALAGEDDAPPAKRARVSKCVLLSVLYCYGARILRTWGACCCGVACPTPAAGLAAGRPGGTRLLGRSAPQRPATTANGGQAVR